MGGERQAAHYHGVIGVLVTDIPRGSESIDGEGGGSAVGTLEEFLMLYRDD